MCQIQYDRSMRLYRTTTRVFNGSGKGGVGLKQICAGLDKCLKILVWDLHGPDFETPAQPDPFL